MCAHQAEFVSLPSSHVCAYMGSCVIECPFFLLTSLKGQNSARKGRERTSNTSWILSCLFDSSVHWLASVGRRLLPREMHLHHRLGPSTTVHIKYQHKGVTVTLLLWYYCICYLNGVKEAFCFQDTLSLKSKHK